MNFISHLAIATLFVVGVAVICGNWGCFYLIFIKKQHAPSWIPLVGGCCLFFSFLFLLDKDEPYLNWIWLVFFIDWGSVPGIGHSILWHLYHHFFPDKEN